jgi:hypothetical protein
MPRRAPLDRHSSVTLGLMLPNLSVDLPDPWIVARRMEPFWRELAPSLADGIEDGVATFLHSTGPVDICPRIRAVPFVTARGRELPLGRDRVQLASQGQALSIGLRAGL